VADFFYEMFHDASIVGNATLLKEMQVFRPLDHGWGLGMPYGLGLFPENYFPGLQSGKFVPEAATYGHGGADWGSGGAPSVHIHKDHSLRVDSVSNPCCS